MENRRLPLIQYRCFINIFFLVDGLFIKNAIFARLLNFKEIKGTGFWFYSQYMANKESKTCPLDSLSQGGWLSLNICSCGGRRWRWWRHQPGWAGGMRAGRCCCRWDGWGSPRGASHTPVTGMCNPQGQRWGATEMELTNGSYRFTSLTSLTT